MITIKTFAFGYNDVVFETERKQLQGFQNIVIWQRYLK
jgi:hypothetical protein